MFQRLSIALQRGMRSLSKTPWRPNEQPLQPLLLFLNIHACGFVVIIIITIIIISSNILTALWQHLLSFYYHHVHLLKLILHHYVYYKSIHLLFISFTIYRTSQKSNRRRDFANLSDSAWNFSMIFDTFMLDFQLCFYAKTKFDWLQHLQSYKEFSRVQNCSH